jgi:hypothetical protein
MDALSNDLTAYFAIIVLVSIAYGKTFGGFQEAITQSVVDALASKSRYRRVTNLAVGMVIALLIAGAAAWKLGTWDVIPIGIIAGLMASVEAARAHETPQAPPTLPAAKGGADSGAGEQPPTPRPPIAERRYPRAQQ